MADGELAIRILSTDRRSIVHLEGAIDVYTSARLRRSLAELIATGARHVVLDLQRVSSITATGVGVVLGAAKRLHRLGGMFELRSPRPAVRNAIEITGLRAVLAPPPRPAMRG